MLVKAMSSEIFHRTTRKPERLIHYLLPDGAEVITKLEDTDYIVIGTRAGPAKLKKINELELETISEEEFFQILENGVPQEKKDRVANRRLADLEGPEEDDDEDTKPKKRAAPKSGPAQKRAKR